MPHIHDAIDFTIAAFIVYQDKVLLVHHKKLDLWLPVGGHIELDEDPDQALFREIQEETGLTASQLRVLSTKPKTQSQRTKPLFTPNFLDIHQITDTHKHVGMIYFLISNSNEVNLQNDEHHDIRWFSESELSSVKPEILPEIFTYAQTAITHANSQSQKGV